MKSLFKNFLLIAALVLSVVSLSCKTPGTEDVQLKEIQVVNLPDKTEYFEGEKFEVKGLTVNAIYSDGSSKPIKDFKTDGESAVKTAGEKNVTVTYKDKTVTFKITVKKIEVTSIEIESLPSKLKYELNQEFNSAGFILKAKYNNGTSKNVTDYTTDFVQVVSEYGKDKTVTVSYLTFTATFKIDVVEWYDTDEYKDGITLSFNFNQISSSNCDWNTHVIVTEENYILTVPNLDPYNNTNSTSTLKCKNAYPAIDGAIMEDGYAWDSAYQGKTVLITINFNTTDGIRYYLDGNLAYTYPMTLWNGNMKEYVVKMMEALRNGTASLNPKNLSSITDIKINSQAAGNNSGNNNEDDEEEIPSVTTPWYDTTEYRNGITLSFDINAVSSSGCDWATQVLATEQNYIITVPNLDPYNNTNSTSTLKGLNAYPSMSGAKIENGYAWDSAYQGKTVSVSINFNTTDGIRYYINGNLAYTYPMTLWNNGMKEYVVAMMEGLLYGTAVLNPLDLTSISNMKITSSVTESVEENPLFDKTSISKIQIVSAPYKINYYEGDSFVSTGLVVKATSTNGATQIVTDYTTDFEDKVYEAGSQKVTVSYGGKTAQFTINVTQLISSDGAWTIKGDSFTHDPTMIYKDGTYYLFYTADFIGYKTSKDGFTWSSARSVFSESNYPSWWNGSPRTGNEVWAPDVVKLGNTYYMYYCISEFGTRNTKIGLCTSSDLINWTDAGSEVWSTTSSVNDYNCIDPNFIEAYDGKYYLAFGSFGTGIYAMELDPATMFIKSGAALVNIARRSPKAIEAPHVWTPGNGYYYLLLSFDKCCNGVTSTYSIRYGRSTSPTGPFVDKNGVKLTESGGTILMQTNGTKIGPGGQSISKDEYGNYILVHHWYDGNNNGVATLGINDIQVTDDGWIELKKHEVKKCGFSGTYTASAYGESLAQKNVTVAPGKIAVTKYVNNSYGPNNWHGAAYKISSVDGNTEYAVLRNDHYGFKGSLNTGDNSAALGWTIKSNWDWSSFVSFQQGATVRVALKNNNGTADLRLEFSKGNETHYQYYSGIQTDPGDILFSIIGDSGADITYLE